MSESHEIPEHAKAGVAFAGVELNDAWGLIASVFLGVFLGVMYGWVFYLATPAVGYIGTKVFLEWKKAQLHGFLTTWLFNKGLQSISAGFKSRKTIFVGDSTIGNPAMSDELDAIKKAAAKLKDK